jgi:fibronectin-binding autotransporter adhesin
MDRLVFKVFFVIFFNIICFNITAVNKYWLATSLSNWNNTANWSTSSGGASGAAVPGAGDIANYDGNGLGNCVVDVGVGIAGINVVGAYTGTISQNAFATITVGTSNAIFSGGTFIGGSSPINFNGTYTLSGTLFTSTTGVCTFKGATTFSSGSFSHNNGTVAFSTNTFTVGGSFTFYNLNILGNFTTCTFSNSNTVQNNLTLTATSGDLGVGLNTLTVNGTILMQGANAVRLSSGTLNALGDITSTFNGDPFSTGTGVINISGTGNQLLNTTSAAGKGILSNITINKTSGTLTLQGNISLYGTWNYIQGTVDAITNSSTVIFPEGNSCVLNGQGSSSTMSFYNVTINISGGALVTLGGNLIVSNNLTINNPSSTTSLNATNNGYSISIGGNLNAQSNTSFLPGNSTVIFNGNGNQTALLGSGTTGQTQNVFYNLTINNTGGNIQLLTNNFWVTNNLVLTTGNVNLNDLTLTLGKSTATLGVLTQTAGWLYGGTFSRWFSTPSLPLATASGSGLFPMGSVSDYCPFWLGYISNLTSGGTVGVNFNLYTITNPGQPTTSVPIDSVAGNIPSQAGQGIVDGTWPNGSGGFLSFYAVTNSYWAVTSSNGFTPNGSTLYLRYGGGTTTFFTNTLSDLAAETAMRSIGSVDPIYGAWSATTNKTVTYEVNRIGVSLAGLTNANNWRIGTTNTLNSPLPIELGGFSAVANGNKVDIKWETITETNNAYFSIEKSKEGKSFTKLIDVPGANNSTTYRDYAETDYQPYSETSYYRLKQTDFNGVFKYLDIICVKMSENHQSISVYPNPIDNTTNLNVNVSGYQNQEIVVVLRDMQGKEFLSRVVLVETNNQLFIVDEAQLLPHGQYIITASTNDKIYNYKLIVK